MRWLFQSPLELAAIPEDRGLMFVHVQVAMPREDEWRLALTGGMPDGYGGLLPDPGPGDAQGGRAVRSAATADDRGPGGRPVVRGRTVHLHDFWAQVLLLLAFSRYSS